MVSNLFKVINNTAMKWLEGFNPPDSFSHQEFTKQANRIKQTLQSAEEMSLKDIFFISSFSFLSDPN